MGNLHVENDPHRSACSACNTPFGPAQEVRGGRGRAFRSLSSVSLFCCPQLQSARTNAPSRNDADAQWQMQQELRQRQQQRQRARWWRLRRCFLRRWQQRQQRQQRARRRHLLIGFVIGCCLHLPHQQLKSSMLRNSHRRGSNFIGCFLTSRHLWWGCFHTN